VHAIHELGIKTGLGRVAKDLNVKEQANMRAAVTFLRASDSGAKPLAKALGFHGQHFNVRMARC